MNAMFDAVESDLNRFFLSEERAERNAESDEKEKADRTENIVYMAVRAPRPQDRFTRDYGIAENVRELLAEWMGELQPLFQNWIAARSDDDRSEAGHELRNAYEKKAAEFTRHFEGGGG